MDYTSYCNDMLVRSEELIYHELSGCAAHKTLYFGIDFIQSRNIKEGKIDQVLQDCIKEIKGNGIVKDMSYSLHGYGIFLRLAVKGCVHMPKEVKLKANGIDPYICPIANMIIDQVILKAHYEAGLIAERTLSAIDPKKNECVLKLAIYETPEKIGEKYIDDWTKYF